MGILQKIFIKKSKVYNSCDEMPLYNFKMYLRTNDLKWFSKNGKEVKGLKDAMISFFDEYLEKTNNRKVKIRFSKVLRMQKLDVKYSSVMLLLIAIYNHKLGKKELEENVKALEKWGYKLNRNKDLFEQLEKIHRRIQNLKSQYELLQIEIQDDDKKESISLERQIILVSKGLYLGYKINEKKTTVLEWIEYQELLKERQKEVKK